MRPTSPLTSMGSRSSCKICEEWGERSCKRRRKGKRGNCRYLGSLRRGWRRTRCRKRSPWWSSWICILTRWKRTSDIAYILIPFSLLLPLLPITVFPIISSPYQSPINHLWIAYESPVNHQSIAYESPINRLWIAYESPRVIANQPSSAYRHYRAVVPSVGSLVIEEGLWCELDLKRFKIIISPWTQ